MANILIVDDNKQTIQHLEELISTFGETPIYILEPEFLFQLLESKSVDLILLDVHMPGTDGVSILKQLKAHPTFQSIPVIMLTGDTDEQLLENCFACGAIDFINKPIHEVILKSRVKSALSIQEHILTLKKRETSLKGALKIATMGTWELDLSSQELNWSQEMYPLFGKSPESYSPTVESLLHLIHPDDQSMVAKFFKEFLEPGKVEQQLDFRIIQPDETFRIVHQQAEIIEKDGKPLHLIGITQDITNQQHTVALQQAYIRQNQIREEERERLAKDLHDEVIQIFSLLKLKLNAFIRAECPTAGPDTSCWLRDNFSSCRELIHSGNQTLRQIVNDLYPSILKDLGLVPAIRSHIHDLNQRMDMEIELHAGAEFEEWPLDIELAVFRVAQEALNNVVKHAKTQKAQVLLGQGDQVLWLQVEDQGCGADLEKVTDESTPKSFGMFFMKDRVQQLGGKITIHSQLGQGTSIFLEIPQSSYTS
ncbi:MAG: response regulator [SAR324 cluster bacterium]|nr:response regulator [SAR324 cluster bacterium]